MSENKICPLSGIACSKEKCAWYSETFEECAVKGVGESLTELFIKADDDGICVRVFDND